MVRTALVVTNLDGDLACFVTPTTRLLRHSALRHTTRVGRSPEVLPKRSSGFFPQRFEEPQNHAV